MQVSLTKLSIVSGEREAALGAHSMLMLYTVWWHSLSLSMLPAELGSQFRDLKLNA